MSKTEMSDATREHYRRKAITCLELTKGFTIEQRNAMTNAHNNCINAIDELSYAIMELTANPIAFEAGKIEGRNEAIEEMIQIIKDYEYSGMTNGEACACVSLGEQLEKLRTTTI